MTLTFDNTRRALVEYDAGAAERNAAWDRIENADELLDAEQADQVALEKVQEAFHKDTADINSRDSCAHAPLIFMRRMAAK
jgi:hypothetical protein